MTHDGADLLLNEIAQALRAPEPLAGLETLARAKAASGVKQEDLYAAFEQALTSAAGEENAESYNALSEAMDFIVGWCAPGRTVYPSSPGQA